LSFRNSAGMNPCIAGATDNAIKQGNRAVEFCIGSYLADKHTHLEAPIRVKKPFLGMRSIVSVEERRMEWRSIGVKWIRDEEERGIEL